MSVSATLARTDLVWVSSHSCCCGRSAREPRRGNPQHLALTRRGVSGLRFGPHDHVAEPLRGIFNVAHDDYFVTHPGDAGHCYTVIEAQRELWDELLQDRNRLSRERELPYDLRSHYAHLQFVATLAAVPVADRLAAEEITLTFLQRLIRPEPSFSVRSSSQRAMIDRVRSLIVAQIDENIGLGILADEAGCSPFHLARVFRTHTGRSIRRFRLESRVANALTLIAAGKDNFSYVAIDCGFSSHSHMTEAFRTIFGRNPSQSRRALISASRAAVTEQKEQLNSIRSSSLR